MDAPPRPADFRVGDLLAAYDPAGSAYLGSPRRSLLATGVRATVPDRRGEGGSLGDDAHRVLREAGGDVVVGAIGFDSASPALLVVPEQVRWADAARRGSGPPSSSTPGDFRAGGAPAGWAVAAHPERAAYAAAVTQALKLIEAGELRKVVLARSLELAGADPIDPRPILTALARRDPLAYAYAVPLPSAPGLPRTLVGASPELLVRRRGDRVVAEPLAGSMARSADPADDERAGKELLASDKERTEHAYVVESVAAALGPLCTELSVPREPTLMSTATMWHLATRVEGRLRATGGALPTSLDLALALHPTPAVCGTPTDAAMAAIADLETFERGYYAGAVGWDDRSGDGEWVIALRCAEILDRSLRLFAGAGIVAGSDPGAELAETSAKLRTLLQAMDIHRDL
jgi:isochorismate synthase